MLLIAGLGNPGEKYARNRHNVGFMAVDRIIDCHKFIAGHNKFNAEIYHGKLADNKTLIIKPQTFMNLSGQAIGGIMRFYKQEAKDMIVIHDDMDLPEGKIRIKTDGGAGGHNGLKSIDAHCGSNYQRIRIGIGHPEHKSKVNSHVLGDFTPHDHQWLMPLLDKIATHIELVINGQSAELNHFLALMKQPC